MGELRTEATQHREEKEVLPRSRAQRMNMRVGMEARRTCALIRATACQYRRNGRQSVSQQATAVTPLDRVRHPRAVTLPSNERDPEKCVWKIGFEDPQKLCAGQNLAVL
jgi:hypothetical protein